MESLMSASKFDKDYILTVYKKNISKIGSEYSIEIEADDYELKAKK